MRGRLTCVALFLAIGCGGGGTLRGSVYSDAEARYRVGELGAEWEPIDLAQNDLAWRNPSVGAIVQVNATCDPFQDVPLTSLTNHLLIGFTQRELQSERLIPLDGREALRSHYVASLDGVPRELLFFVLKKDECTYDFALIAPLGRSFEAARPVFERFVGGFTTDAS
ncbi:MAG: hypothetical protein KC619_26380 [Myxococcales bacterium]|nr:hypothetical protein [Myxococcales bacterium]